MKSEILTTHAYILFMNTHIEKVNYLEKYEVDGINITPITSFPSLPPYTKYPLTASHSDLYLRTGH